MTTETSKRRSYPEDFKREAVALILCSLLRRELQRHDIALSIAGLLDQLGKIREVGIVYPAKDKRRAPTLKTTLSQLSEPQQAL